MLLALPFFLLLLGYNGLWRITPDSAFYASIARRVVEGHGFSALSGDGTLANFGIIYTLAISFQVFGVETMWPSVLLNATLAAAILLVVYRLIRVAYDHKTACVVSCMVGVSATFYRHALQINPDIPFAFGLMLMLYADEKIRRKQGNPWGSLVMLGAGFAVMAAFRMVALIPLTAWLISSIYYAIRKRHWAWTAIPVLMMLGFVILRLIDPREPTEAGWMTKEQEVIRKFSSLWGMNLFYTLRHNTWLLLADVIPEALLGNKIGLDVIDVAISSTTLIAGAVFLRRHLLWALIVFFFILQWLLFLPDVRYLLPILPFLALAWFLLARQAACLPNRTLAVMLSSALIVIWTGMNLGRSIGFVIEQRSRPFYAYYNDGRYAGVREAGLWLKQHASSGDYIAATSKLVSPLMFYSNRVVKPIGEIHSDTVDSYAFLVMPINPDETKHIDKMGVKPDKLISEINRGSGIKPFMIYRIRQNGDKSGYSMPGTDGIHDRSD